MLSPPKKNPHYCTIDLSNGDGYPMGNFYCFSRIDGFNADTSDGNRRPPRNLNTLLGRARPTKRARRIERPYRYGEATRPIGDLMLKLGRSLPLKIGDGFNLLMGFSLSISGFRRKLPVRFKQLAFYRLYFPLIYRIARV